jgi:two-component system chemotaxis response regulator CheY
MKKTVMIIEDQTSTRKLLKHFLGHNYTIVEKANGKEALDSFASGTKVDAIITDMLMPEMTGLDFLRNYQKQFAEKTPPVIMLSSVENSTEKLKCFQLGVRDYVTKPFNPEELKIRLSNVFVN